MTGKTVATMLWERLGVEAEVEGERSGRGRYYTVYLPDDSPADPDAVKRAVAGLVRGRGFVFSGCDVCRGRDLLGPKVVSAGSAELGLWAD